jgi:hypothetical protein
LRIKSTARLIVGAGELAIGTGVILDDVAEKAGRGCTDEWNGKTEKKTTVHLFIVFV